MGSKCVKSMLSMFESLSGTTQQKLDAKAKPKELRGTPAPSDDPQIMTRSGDDSEEITTQQLKSYYPAQNESSNTADYIFCFCRHPCRTSLY